MSEHFSETKISIPSFSLARIWVIATATVTQLVRMKTFYFLIVFALLAAGLGNIDIVDATPVAKLQAVKKIMFGSMDLFAWLYAIVATAILIPKDLEDRTLYTILAKPVRRMEYLIGKLFGVLILIFCSLAIMSCISMGVLGLVENRFAIEQREMMTNQPNVQQDDVNDQIGLIRDQGVKPVLFVGSLASFLKATVVAGTAILISTFASSSLFTIITSIFFFLIGHGHGMINDYWIDRSDSNLLVQFFGKLFKLLIPDYQLFSFTEGVVTGAQVSAPVVWGLVTLTGGYMAVFLLLSLMIFLYKEF